MPMSERVQAAKGRGSIELRPSFLPLFTGVRGIGILRSWTSDLRSSKKFAVRFNRKVCKISPFA